MQRRANYEKALTDISDNLVLMCRYIESVLDKCIIALKERDFDLANEVRDIDKKVNRLERDIEQACFKLLVMENPVATDFREVTAALKMITDLERISDQAWDIANIAMTFKSDKYIEKLDNIPDMAVIVIQMVKDGVQAYINRDLILARSIAQADEKVDELFAIIMEYIIQTVKEKSKKTRRMFKLFMITKYLERIGDHAVNLGEWVEYAITGTHPNHEDEDGEQ